MAAEVFRVVSGADFCRHLYRCAGKAAGSAANSTSAISTAGPSFLLLLPRLNFQGRDKELIEMRSEGCACGRVGKRSGIGAGSGAGRRPGACVWCGVLTGPGALGLVVGLGAGVALLHLQHKARISGLRSRSASLFSRRPFSGGCDLRVAEPARGDTHLLGNVVFIQRMRPQLVSQELEHY